MLNPYIIVKEHSTAGKGLFSTHFIKKGELVWQLDSKEQQLTYEQLQQLPKAERSLAFQFGNRYIICRDDSQYMNHSCDPNVWWSSDSSLEARRDIQAGDEITYDYVTADISPNWTASWQCNCGSPICRRTISSNDFKDKQWQERYNGHLPSWVQKAISETESQEQ
jgi:SET domain-containing protein